MRELGLYGTHAPLVHVTDGRYTLFLSDPAGPSGPPRLYDLARDPNQQRDVLAQHPEIARDFHDFAAEEMARRGAAPKVLEFVRRSRAALG